MTRDEAQSMAQAYLDETAAGNPALVGQIIEDATQEVFCGWVFHYQSKRYLESREIGHAFAGNAPILIDARDGSLHITGTAHPNDYYLRNYQDTGDTGIEATPAVELTGWREGAQKIEGTKLIHRSTSLGLARSKRCIDDALNGVPTIIDMDCFETASQLATGLHELGWDALVKRRAPNKMLR
jgi:Immunity protein 35